MRIGGELLHPIREKMQRTVSLHVQEATLSEVVSRCAAAGDFKVSLNLDSPEVKRLVRLSDISVDLQDVTIEAALDCTLHPRGLEWILRADDLLVTTQTDVIDHYLQVAIFDVTPLIDAGIDGDIIVDTVQDLTAGPWFNLDGIGGHIGEHESLLFVRQTPRQLELTEQLLETMRSAVAGQLEYGSREVRMRTGQQESVVLTESRDSGSESIEFKLFTSVYDVRDIQRYGLFLESDALLSPTLKVPGNAVETAWGGVDAAKDPKNQVWYYFPDAFLGILTDVTSGPWFWIDGMGGFVGYAGAGVLVVRQIEETHQEIESLLDRVRTALSEREPPKPFDVNRIETHTYSIDADVESPEKVLEAIKTFIAPDTWGAENPETGIMILGKVIVVRSTYAVRIQIEELLSEAGVWGRVGTF